MTVTEKDQVFSKSEACKFLQVSPRTLDRMIANNELDYFRVGSGKGRVRFTKRSLLDAMNRTPTRASRNSGKGRQKKAAS